MWRVEVTVTSSERAAGDVVHAFGRLSCSFWFFSLTFFPESTSVMSDLVVSIYRKVPHVLTLGSGASILTVKVWIIFSPVVELNWPLSSQINPISAGFDPFYPLQHERLCPAEGNKGLRVHLNNSSTIILRM